MNEDELRLENVSVEIKRNYKTALANLETVKKDTADILVIKQKAQEDLVIVHQELNKVKNDISQEKLNWATFKHNEMVELERKNSEADNILKRKIELNQQEEEIRKVEASNIEILNETRRTELKVKNDTTALEVREVELDQHKKDLESLKKKILKDQDEFKRKIINVLQEVEKV